MENYFVSALYTLGFGGCRVAASFNHLLHEQMRTPLMMAEIEDEMVASIRRLNSELPPLPAHYLPVRSHAARLH